MTNLIVKFFYFFIFIPSIVISYNNNNNRYVVYDNVLNDKICKLIDLEAINGGLGHTVYDRSISPRSCIEATCNDILKKLGDESKYIEYWWRDEWIHLDSHKDCDEYLAKITSPPEIKYPINGHVLYLEIGLNVLGPTCLFFENKTSLIEEMAIIPAVKGRLLRFDGNLMHAVPRPALGYLDPEDGGSNLEIWSRTKRIPGVIDEESTIFRRSVLLFNTWNNLPMEVDTNIPLGTETYNKNNPNNQFDILEINKDWNKINPITNEDEIKSIHLKIMMLGNSKERRGRLSRRIDLRGPLHIKNSLLDNKIPSYYKVYEE